MKALEKADWWDRALIASAFLFFLLCVAYVIKRRVLDRVGGLAAWWVGGSFRLLRMGLTGKPARKVVEDVTVSQGSAVASAAAVTGAAIAGAAGAAAGAVKQELDKKQAADIKVIPKSEGKGKREGKGKKKGKKGKKQAKKVVEEPETVTVIEEVVPTEPAGDSKVGGVKVEL